MGLQAHECNPTIKSALAAGLSFILPKCGSRHKKLVHISSPPQPRNTAAFKRPLKCCHPERSLVRSLRQTQLKDPLFQLSAASKKSAGKHATGTPVECGEFTPPFANSAINRTRSIPNPSGKVSVARPERILVLSNRGASYASTNLRCICVVTHSGNSPNRRTSPSVAISPK